MSKRQGCKETGLDDNLKTFIFKILKPNKHLASLLQGLPRRPFHMRQPFHKLLAVFKCYSLKK